MTTSLPLLHDARIRSIRKRLVIDLGYLENAEGMTLEQCEAARMIDAAIDLLNGPQSCPVHVVSIQRINAEAMAERLGHISPVEDFDD